MKKDTIYMVGIDIGSSSCKIGVFDVSGNIVHLTRKKVILRMGSSNALEAVNYPELLWNEILEGLAEACTITQGHVSVISLTGQIGTNFFLDQSNNLILSPISWKNGIGGIQAKRIWEEYGQDEMDNLLGLHVAPGAAWPIARFAWLKENQPHFFEGNNKLAHPKDYIGYRLTGNLATDVLSLRGLVNPDTKEIDVRIKEQIIKIESLEQYLPTILPDETSVLGTIGIVNSTMTGLSPNTPVVIGCGDFHSALIGSGIIDTSHGFNITGTSEHVGTLVFHEKMNVKHIKQNRYPFIDRRFDVFYGVTSAGGGSMDWFLETFCTDKERSDIEKTVLNLISNLSDFEIPIYLPYLNGERAPIWNVNARGVFFGLSSENTKGDILKAILEGVGFSLFDNWRLLVEDTQENKDIVVSGAAAKDDVWNQIKADIFGTPFINMKCNETSCLGAAILGACGIGIFSNLSEAIHNMTEKNQVYYPHQNKHEKYYSKFLLFKELYKKLIPLFESYADLGRKK